MSFAALAAVSKMHLGSAAEKLIALAYADRHNEETGCAYPSLAWLCEFSSLNRKTVIAAVARLEAVGLLTDTGEREGRTGQIKVYRMGLGTVPKSEWFQKRDDTETGTVPKTTGKQSQKRDTEPVREPTPTVASQPTEIVADEPRLLPEHVLEAWNDMAARCGLPKAKLTDARRKVLRARIRQHSITDFTEAIGCIERNPWMHGENDRGWRADFDFLLQPKSFVKLTEGSYDRAV